MDSYSLIGGFAFNCQPLQCLAQLPIALSYVDINTLLTAPFTLDDLAAAVIQQLTPDKQHSLIAYSTGGLVALKIAERQPDLIKQIVLIHSTPKFIEEEAWPGIRIKDFKRLWLKLNTLSLSDFLQHFTQVAALPHAIKAQDYQSWWSDTTQENLMALMTIIETTDLRHALSTLPMDIRFINAMHDSLVPFTDDQYLTDSTHLQCNSAELLVHLKTALCL